MGLLVNKRTTKVEYFFKSCKLLYKKLQKNEKIY